MKLFELLRTIPILRITIPFILGIVLQLKFNINKEVIYVGLIFSIVLSILLKSTNWVKKAFSRRVFWGIIFHVFLIFTGAFYFILRETQFNSLVVNKKTVIAIISEAPRFYEKSVKIIADIQAVDTNNIWQQVDTRAILWIKTDSLSKKLEYGDQVLLNADFSKVQNKGNPEEFDYAKYLTNKNIYHQAFVKKWKLLNKEQGNTLVATALKWRKKLLGIYQENGLEGDEYAVAAALTLGYKDELDNETKKAYSTSGAMHVLAVSGLHVGIVSGVLIFLFKLFKVRERKHGALLEAVVIIILLWIFAFITGLSPSVQRAALMFTFLAAARIQKAKSNFYNILAGSAFTLLIINPYLITEVGFILSYSAVIAIVFFQPKFHSLWQAPNKIVDAIWQLMTVSTSAQIGNFAFAVLYFHQFPNYFILTNLFVIFLAMFIVYAALLLFITSAVPILAFLFSKALTILVWIMNFIVSTIDQLPGALTPNIYISGFDTFIIYLIIFSITAFFIHRKASFLKLSFLTTIIFSLSVGVRAIERKKTCKAVIYNSGKNFSADFIYNKNCINLCDTFFINHPEKQNFFAQSNRIKLGINKPIQSPIYLHEKYLTDEIKELWFRKNNFFAFAGKQFFLINNSELNTFYSKKAIEIDYLILSGKIRFSIDELKKMFRFKEVIISAASPMSYQKRWKKECKENKIPIHIIAEKGAWVKDLAH